MLGVANRTTNTGWQDNGISANANDSVAFKIYYHNGVVGSTARNTKIRLNFPTNPQNTINAVLTLGADNAAVVNDSVVINNSVAQRLAINTDSFLWYPNQSQTAIPVSAAASGPGFIELNIGDIQGGWQFQGYVTFTANLAPIPPLPAPTPTPTPIPSNFNLSIVKLVRNQTAGQINFVKYINANANDWLTWQIQITNSGNASLTNVIARDTLPSQLSYVAGSTLKNSSFMSDGLINNGINIGSLTPGATATLTFDTITNSVSFSQTSVNFGFARADQISEFSDTASVFIALTPTPTPIPTPTPGSLSITKTVRNITSGYGYFSKSANASNGDRVTFQIQINNNSNFNANNVIVSDSLPSGLSYVPGSSRLDNGYISDNIISGGVNIGSMYPGAAHTINFDATIGYLGTGYGNQTLTNYAYVRANQINEINDSATVYASQSSPYAPYTPYYPPTAPNYYSNLIITKMVRNVTSGQTGLASSANAQIGDKLTFAIQLTTPSGSNQYNQVNNVRVWDILPSGLTYIPNTAKMDGGWISDSFATSNGVNIGTIFGNQTKTITFDATINSYGGNQTMTNYGYAAGDGIVQQSAFAQIITGVAPIPFAPAPIYSPTPPPAPAPVVKGAYIKAVTGSNDLPRNMAISLMISLLGIFLIYLCGEYAPAIDWKNLKFKFIVWRIRVKEKLI